jgi:hypothetical protein
MRWYGEIINERMREKGWSTNPNFHYHEWSKESIERFWQIHTHSLIVDQFYPLEYWYDFITWSQPLIKSLSVNSCILTPAYQCCGQCQ